MKKLLYIGLLCLAIVGCENKKGAFLETVQSQNDLQTTVKKLKSIINKKGLTIFNTIDHKANALKVKMNLRPKTVVIFGNPKMGTILMQCNPSMGIDLPLRVLVSTSYEGETTLIYTNPEYWSLKHNIKDKKCLNILGKAKIALANITAAAAEK